MTNAGSVTYWLGRLKAGEPAAAQPIWDRYFTRLVGLAETKLRGLPRAAADEEDVALSAFSGFCLAAQRGQFPQLHDRDDLWQLLALLAERKARDYRRREGRQKRGGGRVHDETWLDEAVATADGERGLAALAADEPTPEFAAVLAEECRVLLGRLADERLRAIAIAKMEGYRNDEVAGQLGCSLRTIERKLGLIRAIWQRSVDDAGHLGAP